MSDLQTSDDAPSPAAARKSAAPRGTQISNAIVGLYRAYYGKGPTRAKTHITGDLIVCVLEDTLNVGERNLIAAGNSDAVVHLRESFQRAFRDQFISAVEQTTGRSVRVFHSAQTVAPDIATELFLLEPIDVEPGDSIDVSGDGA